MALLSSAGSNEPVKMRAEAVYTKFISCSNEYGDKCRNYTSELISSVYGIMNLKEEGRFMSNSELAIFISEAENWKLLGPAYRHEVLAESQKLANESKPVVAVYRDEYDRLMHVAVVLPGEMKPSGTWGMLVPNSVSLAVYDANHSFINKGLSYAFEKHMLLRVKMYAYK